MTEKESKDEGEKKGAEKKRKKEKGVIRRYARFLVNYPYLILAIMIILTIIGGFYANKAELVQETAISMLPQGIEAVDTFLLVEDQFPGVLDTARIVVQTTPPQYAKSEEIRDVRDPEVLRYVDAISKRAKLVPGVLNVQSAADVIKAANNGTIPSSLRSVKKLLEEDESAAMLLSSFISDDYMMSVIIVGVVPDYDGAQITDDLRDAMNLQAPFGTSVDLTGDVTMVAVGTELADADVAKTASFSMILLILILILVSRSFKYGLIPLIVIIAGIQLTFAVYYLLGYDLTSTTSGSVTMILGIGIDFGIQVTMRFRDELNSYDKDDAMVNTFDAVFTPMCITTIAAIIGCLCLHLSRLTPLGDMGTILAMGVLFCMIAAVTILPVVLVLVTREKKQGVTMSASA